MWVSRVRWVGRVVGGPVWVAGRELGVADVRGDHVLLHHHHVHRDEVALQRLNAVFSVVMWVAPVVLEVEKSLRLGIMTSEYALKNIYTTILTKP